MIEYLQFGETYTSDAYNLPVDTIYYLESRWNYRQNEYVREHLQEMERYINRFIVRDRMYFPYKLVYLSRQESEILEAVRDLHPELRNVAYTASAQTDPEWEYQCGLREKQQHPYRKVSFTAHLFPSAEGEYRFLTIDTEMLDNESLLSVLCNYADTLSSRNRRIIRSGKDTAKDESGPEVSYYEAQFGSRPRRNEPQTRFRMSDRRYNVITEEELSEPFSMASMSCCEIDPEEHERRAEENKRKEEERQRREEEFRRKALAFKTEIEGMQRDNGITILTEILGANIIKQLQEQLPEKSLEQTESLVIDEQYKILLPEYDMEIPLRPLEKALYILFLRHPEGIERKRIDEHKEELRTIYLKLATCKDMQLINQSIDDLTMPESDSLNQKVSKINAAFRNRLAEDIARNYFITGPRGEAKRVVAAESAQIPSDFCH